MADWNVQEEVGVDTVDGALGPLYCATIMIAGTPVEGLVDPGSSATILFDLFREIGRKASIPCEALTLPEVTLRDYSRRPIPIFAVVDLEFCLQGRSVTVPVYLRSDQGPVSEPCLLGTNVVIPLGLMVPGPGVHVRSSVMCQGGVVRLVKAERIPSHCGVCVEAVVEGCDGTVLVEPKLVCAGLEFESMLVEPDSSGKTMIVLSNHSVSAVCLGAGRKIGFAQSCEQYVGSSEEDVSFCEQAERSGDVCEVTVDSPGGRKEKLRDLLHLPRGCDAVGTGVGGA